MKEGEQTASALRHYLQRGKSSPQKDVNPIFEDFLNDLSTLFTLRIASEEYWGGSPRLSVFETPFKEHRYQAENNRKALPLEWKAVRSIVLPDHQAPRRTLITYIAAHCIEEIRFIALGLRRILTRERLSTPVGKVQQLDTYCMRWLMRQPGRSFAEKAGTRQRVMSVVRQEQFDTLENRVFKDFLIRCITLADSYLLECKENYSEHKVVKAVRELQIICQGALEKPEMGEISALSTFPQPNYVLQQDNRYSKIWSAYSQIMHFSNLAEALWNDRIVLKKRLEALKQISDTITSHEMFFQSKLWIYPINGKSSYFEGDSYMTSSLLQTKFLRLATWEQLRAREQRKKMFLVEDGIGVVDFTGPHVWGNLLIRGGIHTNASPHISCGCYPIWDDDPDVLRLSNLAENQRTYLISILSALRNPEQQNSEYIQAYEDIRAYCKWLWGEYKELNNSLEEIVITIPDDWDAVMQESIIQAFSMLNREKVRLLWKSISTVLGMDSLIQKYITKEGEEVAVIDFRNDNSILITRLQYLWDSESRHWIPQREAFKKNGKINIKRYLVPKSMYEMKFAVWTTKIVCVTGTPSAETRAFFEHGAAKQGHKVFLNERNTVRVIDENTNNLYFIEEASSWIQKDGALLFCREHTRRTLYFDELEPMWVVGQQNEKIIQRAMVRGDNKFRGGNSLQSAFPAKFLAIAERHRGKQNDKQEEVRFLFHIGELNRTTLLHSYKKLLDELPSVHGVIWLEGTVSVSPGQGIAITTFSSPFFKEPLILDYLHDMTLSKSSVASLEKEMSLSFPPICAIVEAFSKQSYRFPWLNSVRDNITGYIYDRKRIKDIPNDSFAHPQRKGLAELNNNESELHLLDRRNVFGNCPTALRPYWLSEAEENILIKKLVADYNSYPDICLRLLAWMYRGDNSILLPLIQHIVTKYEQGVLGRGAEVSFLANQLSAQSLKVWEIKTLDIFLNRLDKELANAYDFRLFYNLLQFDVSLFEKYPLTYRKATKIAENLIKRIIFYRKYCRAMLYTSCLRCFLYFLRFRENKHNFLRPKEFYNQEEDIPIEDIIYMEDIYEKAERELQEKYSFDNVDTTRLKEITHKFLTGKGSLEDLLQVSEDKSPVSEDK